MAINTTLKIILFLFLLNKSKYAYSYIYNLVHTYTNLHPAVMNAISIAILFTSFAVFMYAFELTLNYILETTKENSTLLKRVFHSKAAMTMLVVLILALPLLLNLTAHMSTNGIKDYYFWVGLGAVPILYIRVLRALRDNILNKQTPRISTHNDSNVDTEGNKPGSS
ncbi:hypothetical protein PsAD13_02689 [Pseudovibrio sp. Ad13]|nr:hypothetical protein PsAD13_02689 [Pseudovibrio sp. Ad13]